MAFYFAGFFFLRELIFADRGQSAKSAKIRTRKIFMLHGSTKTHTDTHLDILFCWDLGPA